MLCFIHPRKNETDDANPKMSFFEVKKINTLMMQIDEICHKTVHKMSLLAL